MSSVHLFTGWLPSTDTLCGHERKSHMWMKLLYTFPLEITKKGKSKSTFFILSRWRSLPMLYLISLKKMNIWYFLNRYVRNCLLISVLFSADLLHLLLCFGRAVWRWPAKFVAYAGIAMFTKKKKKKLSMSLIHEDDPCSEISKHSFFSGDDFDKFFRDDFIISLLHLF